MITAIYLAAIVCIVIALAFSRSRVLSAVLGVLFLGVQIMLTVHGMMNPGKTELSYFSFDSLGLILLLTLSIISVPALIHSRIYLTKPLASPSSAAAYNASFVLLIAAMTMGYLANHAAVTWIFTEITTLSAAMLIYHHRSKLALEATWKYVFVCAISICFVFVGILLISLALLHDGCSELFYSDLMAHKATLDGFWMKLGFLFIFAGYTAKLGLFPMFTAGVDAKDKAPAPAGALLASALMNLGFCGIFRVYAAISGTPVGNWARIVMLVSALITLFIATIYMARIGNVKRMLAYSGIEHMSVVTLGLCFGKAGFMAAMLHMVMHTFVKSGLFFHFTQLYRTYSSKMIDDMGDYLKLNPFGAIVLLFGFVSIAAVPPSGLFFSELLVFKAMIAEGNWVVFVLTAFLLTVLLWAFAKSMFRIIFLPASKPVEKIRISAWESLTQLILFVLAAYIGFNPPAFLTELIGQAAAMIL
ncbi:MAG: hypothetical protein KBT05_09220 [Bacteroidales bacterium]|nr:hypothetical protein [Candidatus Cryptobacteroides caccocaballi]